MRCCLLLSCTPAQDIYTHLKAPPLRDSQLMALRDPAIGWLNSAIIYNQDTRPDGPAVYMLAEVIDRLERWAEAAEWLREKGRPAGCWEQMTLSDALLSAVSGRPIAYGCWERVPQHSPGHQPNTSASSASSSREAWWKAHKRLFGVPPEGKEGGLTVWQYMQQTKVPWPASLASHAPGFKPFKNTVWSQTLQVPNTQGTWP
ncbi:hypothetical protein Agub_g3880, partial [Astrephomene gubernaculifera]